MDKEENLTPKRKLFLEEWYENNFKYIKNPKYFNLFNFNDLELEYLYLIYRIPRMKIIKDLREYKSYKLSYEDVLLILSDKYSESISNIAFRIDSLFEIDNYLRTGKTKRKK